MLMQESIQKVTDIHK